MCLTNLTFADKQSKLQLSLNIEFLNSLLSQLNYLFCEELIQVTSSVLRNLSWKASKTCKTILSELNSASLLMSCSMQIKKETTLKCILYSLWNISSHNIQNKQQICEVDGSIKFLISLLEYRSSNNTLTIVENITGVMKNISSFIIKFEHLRKILRINNCHEILLKHLKSTSLTIVCNCVGVLWNLSKDNLLDQKILINLGAISFLKNLTLSKHKIIAIASKEALKNLLTSECLKNNQLDLESISFKAFSMDRLNCTNLLSNRKRMLLKRELKNSLKETQSISNGLLGIKNNNDNDNKINLSQTTLTDLNNQTSDYQLNIINDYLNNETMNNNNIQKSFNSNSMSSQFINSQLNEINSIHKRTEILDVTHSASDYFDLYKDNNDNLSCLNDNSTIDNLLQGLTTLKEQNLDTILNNDFYLNTNMVTSCNFPTCYLSSSTRENDELIKRSSIYSTISEPPIMYYDNDNHFTFTEKDLNDLTSEELLEEEFRKLSFKNDFRFFDSSSVFHAYPVIIQESNECLREEEEANLFDDDLYKEKNEQKILNEKEDKKKIKLNSYDKIQPNTINATITSKIPVPVQQNIKPPKIRLTNQSKQNKIKKQNNNNGKEIIKSQNNLSSSYNSLSSNNSSMTNNTTKSTNNCKSSTNSQSSSSNNLPSKQLMQQQKTKKETPHIDSKVKTSLKSKLPSRLPSTTTKLTKSKTMEKNLNTFTSNLPKSRTTESLCNMTYDLINEDLDEINNDNTEANDLTYNIDIDRRNNNNITYILPSSESSDRTLKNEIETDERTLVWQPDNEDEKTDKQIDEINTYVQNFNSPNNDDNLDDDDDATLHINEVNLEIDSTSIENLNLIDTQVGCLDGTEIADSFSFIENTKPPVSYDQINFSITSSLNNSLFNSGDNQLSIKNKNNTSTESSTTSTTNSKLSRLRSPKAKVFDLSCSPPTNTFTITKSTKLNKSKDQALSTSGYQTSLNSSLISNNSFAIDKINPPSILNQISVISLNASAYDCISTCDSISSINSDINPDLSTANNSLNSSLNGSPFKIKPIKTSTPKHQLNKSSCSKIAKPITHLTSNNSIKTNNQTSNSTSSTISKTDTFRKNKASVKKLNTSSSICSSTISSTSSSTKSDNSTKIKSTPLKVNNQDNLKKKTITTSKSMSRISTLSTEQKKKTTQSKISTISSNLWKKTVSNQQNISSKVFKKKSSLTTSLDKKERLLLNSNNQQNTNSLIRSSTFEKLPTSTQEAIKISSTTNKNKIRPIELQNGKRSIYH